MSGAQHYLTEVATAAPTSSLRDVADLMHRAAIGCVVLVDGDAGPVGIVTDRDLVRRVVAQGLDVSSTSAGDVMSKPVVTIGPDAPLEELTAVMRDAGVRRVPVVRDGKVVGIVSLDDVLVSVGRELADLGEAARREVLRSRKEAQRERKREKLEAEIGALREAVGEADEAMRAFLLEELQIVRTRVKEIFGPPGKPPQ